MVFLTLFYNYSFFKNVLKIYPFHIDNLWFLISVVFIFVALNILIFTILSSRYTTKPILIITFLVSSLASYFMNSYNIVINDEMIRNLMQTNIDESFDLITLKEIFYFIVFGVLPSIFIYKADIDYQSFKKEMWTKIKVIVMSIAIIAGLIFTFSKYYSSFFRTHKPLRFSANPTFWMYSVGKYVNSTINSRKVVVKSLGLDAKIEKRDRKKLVIMVVGEAARADHFSLNGYENETNPLLKKQNIINLSNVSSCGTSTAKSVPCMFSFFTKENFSHKKGITNENILDVLKHTKDIDILWRDNNSDSKGVALRVEHHGYKDEGNNTICDTECRDEGMLVGLDKYVQEREDKDILIVLHQMGNHGPAYYKRYPKKFEKFKPVCKTNQLEHCTKKEINNAYDNAILYTDYFLNKTINFLKNYETTYDTTLLYFSDHGESLGENGIYLHGLPYIMAPEAQTHIGALMWFGKGVNKKRHQIKDDKFSHDNLFHTLLGLFKVQTSLYDKSLDILKD